MSATLESSLGRFKSGVSTMQGTLDEVVTCLEREREELSKAREALDVERAAFDEEKARVQQVINECEQVTLNIGGSRFTTTVTTLKNAPSPSLFNAMFSGRHRLKTDESGCYFIDRDGRHFHDILNYLRDGQFSYPSLAAAVASVGGVAAGVPPPGSDFKYLLELRAEAEFYGLVDLVSTIDTYPYNLTTVMRASRINTTDHWLYEDGNDDVVFTVDRKCQLLGAGLCGTLGGFVVELDVYEVDPEQSFESIETLSCAAQSFTKADGDIVRLFLPAPVVLLPGKTYMLSALIKGSESSCCEDCMETVIAGGVKVCFQAFESPNGTNETRGQIPHLYIRAL